MSASATTSCARAAAHRLAPTARPLGVVRVLPPRAWSAGRRPLGVAALAFIACFAYAFIRYVVVKGDPLSAVPVYVTNKAVAMWSVLALAAAIVRPRAPWRRFARRGGVAAATVHALASLALLGSDWYPKLYAASPPGALRPAGEIALLLGVGAFTILLSVLVSRPADDAARRRAGLVASVALATTLVHSLTLAACGSLAPAGWPGGLPPITLLSAAIAATGVLAATWRAIRARV